MEIHSSILAWKISWMEESARLQSMRSQESNMTERLHFQPIQMRILIGPRNAWVVKRWLERDLVLRLAKGRRHKVIQCRSHWIDILADLWQLMLSHLRWCPHQKKKDYLKPLRERFIICIQIGIWWNLYTISDNRFSSTHHLKAPNVIQTQWIRKKKKYKL